MINIIMGMHRSGTSAIAGLLHTNGIVMGEERFFRPEPSPENPKGYFEDVRFRDINDAVLAHNHYYVKNWKMPIGAPYWDATPELFNAATVLIKEMDEEYPSWGWKDPRTCLTWPFWFRVIESLGLLEKTSVIVTHRDPYAIAGSMIKRGNSGSLHYFAGLARAYDQCARLARPEVTIKFTDSPRMIQNQLACILDVYDLSFLDDRLRHRT